MKIAMIGLGDIARKAYLPVLGTCPELEISLVTRNEAVLNELGARYRIPPTARLQSVEALDSQTEAAFVHTATESHYEIVRHLLQRGVHVYVDKPLDYHIARSRELVALAERQHCVLMTGFNRRFAPLYRQLKERAKPDILLMQKNRVHLPGDIRSVVLDDFIHVVDTLRYFYAGAVREKRVRWQMNGPLLAHVVLELTGDECTAIGIMNRESGITEETLEVMGGQEKWAVRDLRECIHYADGGEQRTKLGDWTSVGVARGFEAIVADFFAAVAQAKQTGRVQPAIADLQTHEICEEIVQRIESSLE